jgi:peptidoglycan/xylan/chitin deacetylase (PgdA/CDA1 family)
MFAFGGVGELAERWRRFPGLERVEAPGRAVLTFEDGPDREHTPAVLDALEAEGLLATFFLVGEQLMNAPRLGRELRQRGHEVALHGFEHVDHDSLHPGQARDDLARALGAIEAATAVRPRWCRPPYGRFSEASYGACAHLGFEPVYWSAWGPQEESTPAERIAEAVGRGLDEGAIVVLLDSARYAPGTSAGSTAAAVRLIAAQARERGLELVTLGAVAEERPPAGPG